MSLVKGPPADSPVGHVSCSDSYAGGAPTTLKHLLDQEEARD